MSNITTFKGLILYYEGLVKEVNKELESVTEGDREYCLNKKVFFLERIKDLESR